MSGSYTISWTYNYPHTQPPWVATEGHPYLVASLIGDPNSHSDWWYWTKPPDPYADIFVHAGSSGAGPGYAVGGPSNMSLEVSWTTLPGSVTRKLYIESDLMFTETATFDPYSWTFWMLDTVAGGSGCITDLAITSGFTPAPTWDYANNGRVVVSISAVSDLRAPRVIRFANGVEMVSRAGSVWRRLSPDHAWGAARTATDTAPILMPGIARTGNAVCLDTAAVQSASAGTGWTTSPPTNVLPTDIAGWPRGATGLRDLLVSPANSKALGATVESGSLKAYLQGQSTATLASLGTATVGGPVVARDTQGRWYVGALVDGTWREWRTGSSWSSWTELSAQSLGATAAWSNACLWCGANGLQLLAGYHKSAGKVRAVWRTGFAATWSSPADIATVTADVAPYAVQLRDGRWEIGWRTATAWVLYRAATPGGTWTVVT